jgi:ribosome-interacting GTPase 1
MVQFEDVQIQLIDMPPITADYVAPGQVGTYRNCDLIAIVIDLSAEIKEQMEICLNFLESRSLLIDAETPAIDQQGNVLGKRAFCICTKSDDARPNAVKAFKKSCNRQFDFVKISTKTGEGLDELPENLFRMLKIIRIYAKPPGKKADMDEPFTLLAGATVMDMATAIHRELTEKLKFARIWGTGVYNGQTVQKNHVIEFHFS